MTADIRGYQPMICALRTGLRANENNVTTGEDKVVVCQVGIICFLVETSFPNTTSMSKLLNNYGIEWIKREVTDCPGKRYRIDHIHNL